jgi:hypothetical protein
VKHISPKFFFIHDLQKDSIITVQQICSSENLADLFTKALPTWIQEIGTWYWIATAKRHQVMLPSRGVNMCVIFFLGHVFFPQGFSLARFLTRHAIHLLMDIHGGVL